MSNETLAMCGNLRLLCNSTNNFSSIPSTSEGARMFLGVEDISEGKSARATTRFNKNKRIQEVSLVQFYFVLFNIDIC